LPLPLPLPLQHRPIFLLFTAVTERNFLTYFLQNNGILQRQKGETATEERQRNGGNQALGLSLSLEAQLLGLGLAQPEALAL